LKAPKISPKVKNELKKKVPTFMQKQLEDQVVVSDDNGSPLHWNQTSPSEFMKHMDSSFESFFY